MSSLRNNFVIQIQSKMSQIFLSKLKVILKLCIHVVNLEKLAFTCNTSFRCVWSLRILTIYSLLQMALASFIEVFRRRAQLLPTLISNLFLLHLGRFSFSGKCASPSDILSAVVGKNASIVSIRLTTFTLTVNCDEHYSQIIIIFIKIIRGCKHTYSKAISYPLTFSDLLSALNQP